MTIYDGVMADMALCQTELWRMRVAAHIEANPSCTAQDILDLLEEGVREATTTRVAAYAANGKPADEAEREARLYLSWIRGE
ncbi:hypothetical protein AB5J55_35475 [Streptomyces sp. R11]|uniref:Uncharacterized protein n=1 Tax=Streptomyces sp. R11 TaxID=3238625 RepID=A0AB39N9K9_9ACTN